MPNDVEIKIVKVEDLKPGMVLSANLVLKKTRIRDNKQEEQKLKVSDRALTEEEINQIQTTWKYTNEDQGFKNVSMTVKVYKSMALPTNVNSTFSESELAAYKDKISKINSSDEINGEIISDIVKTGEEVKKKIESALFLDCDINTVVGGYYDLDEHVRNVAIAAVAVAIQYNNSIKSKNIAPIKIEEVSVASMIYKIGAKYKKLPPEIQEKKLAELKNKFNHANRGYVVPDEAFTHYIDDMEAIYSYNSIAKEYENSVVRNAVLLYKENKKGTGPLKYVAKDNKNMITQILQLCDSYYTLLQEKIKNNETPHVILTEMLEKVKNNEFSEELYKLFLQKIPMYPRGSKLLLSNGQVVTVSVPNKENPSKPIVSGIFKVNVNGVIVLREGEFDLNSPKFSEYKVSRFLGEGFDKDIDLDNQRELELDMLEIKYKRIIENLVTKKSEYELIKSFLMLSTIDLDMVHSDILALFNSGRLGNGNNILRQKITEQIKTSIENIPFSEFKEAAEFMSKDKNTTLLIREKEFVDKNKEKRKLDKQHYAAQEIFKIKNFIGKAKNDSEREEIISLSYSSCYTEELKIEIDKVNRNLFPEKFFTGAEEELIESKQK